MLLRNFKTIAVKFVAWVSKRLSLKLMTVFLVVFLFSFDKQNSTNRHTVSLSEQNNSSIANYAICKR